mgnify:CR=1 FL=1|jgi:hypothetical protein|tara:strand:+ start:1004 stop:1750 length:747 start_codon:yes stop_codon:yes gene_type:complete
MNIYFLTGMPRAGNTLFGSLMNQNPNVKVSPNSVNALLIRNILKIKHEQLFKNFPDHKAVDNIINNYFKNYYEHYNCKNILDRAPWGLPEYHLFLKQIIKNRKYVILYRPFLEVLASFVVKDKPTDIENYCYEVIQGKWSSIVMDNLISIQNIVKEKENYIIVHYKNLIKEPSVQLKKVCNFLNIEFIEPNYNNIEQFNINEIKYDDSVLSSNFHTINTNGIQDKKTIVEDILPESIINKYKNFDVRF